MSRAVLIGVSTYRDLPALPAVSANLTALADVLADGWDVAVVREPRSPIEVRDALAGAAGTDRLLLVYFAGHGLADVRTGELHLAVADSAAGTAYATAVPYDWIRRIVLDSPARQRVVILDCCYAGRAIPAMGVPVDVEIDRSCVLVAASANRLALAPPGETYTAFTGVLLDLLIRGVPGGPDPLDLTTIYEEMVRIQRARGRPLPELRARNGGERIPLVRNAAAPATYAGRIFVADRRCADPDLAGGTVAILAHSRAGGALGVRLDRTATRSPADLLGAERAAALDSPPVFDGGPVRDVVLLVVAPRGEPPGFRPLSAGLGTMPLTADPEILATSVASACLFVGYVGWPPGRLEYEISQRALISTGGTVVDWLAKLVV